MQNQVQKLVSDMIDNVSRDADNKTATLNNTIKSVCECVNENMNAHMVQTWKETDQHGQEITAASGSLLASISEHKEKMRVATDNLSQEIRKSNEYADSKFSTVSEETQDISAVEILTLIVLMWRIG